MRVGLSLLTLVPGVSGGSETYARELTAALARVGALDYELLLPRIAADVGGLPGRVVDSYAASRSTAGRVRAMGAATLGRKVRRELAAYDLVHFPLTVMIPPLRRPPAVTTIHDVQHEELPAFFSRAERAYRKIVYAWTARLSSLVITISNHAAEALAERLHLAPERIRTIHYGLNHELFRPGPETREEFLLYPALAWPHKNHARLFEAFAAVRTKHPDLRLLLPGYSGPTTKGAEALGWTAPADLARLYRTAAAVVFPSLYEGFGQPPLEAMASGCAVACSNAASLPEVCGDAARLFDPLSVDEMAAAMHEVLDNPEPFRARGLANAARFTWERAAEQHDAVYREIGSSGGTRTR